MKVQVREIAGIFLLSALVLSSCGNDGENSTSKVLGQLDGKEYIVVWGDETLKDETGENRASGSVNAIRGTGGILFKKSLGGKTSSKSYSFDVALEDEGSVTTHSHCSTELRGGVDLQFKRSGKTLKVLTTIGGKTQEFVPNGDASKTMSIEIEVHNGEDPSHVIVHVNGEEIIDTIVDAHWNSGQGTGEYWGLSLSSASIVNVDVKNAEAHDH